MLEELKEQKSQIEAQKTTLEIQLEDARINGGHGGQYCRGEMETIQ